MHTFGTDKARVNRDLHPLLFGPVRLWRWRSGIHTEVVSMKRTVRPSVRLGQDNEGGDDNGQGGLPFQAGVLSHAAKGGLRLL